MEGVPAPRGLVSHLFRFPNPCSEWVSSPISTRRCCVDRRASNKFQIVPTVPSNRSRRPCQRASRWRRGAKEAVELDRTMGEQSACPSPSAHRLHFHFHRHKHQLHPIQNWRAFDFNECHSLTWLTPRKSGLLDDVRLKFSTNKVFVLSSSFQR